MRLGREPTRWSLIHNLEQASNTPDRWLTGQPVAHCYGLLAPTKLDEDYTKILYTDSDSIENPDHENRFPGGDGKKNGKTFTAPDDDEPPIDTKIEQQQMIKASEQVIIVQDVWVHMEFIEMNVCMGCVRVASGICSASVLNALEKAAMKIFVI
ncbi:hypothetical protein BDP27DRAFT_1406450 [Rhodocollybia butyracea]|uniref:Uncharacterized protein n=1 Tax=Rhodocollybia butyracea TaxID=206335 RepID=A0A9P5TZU0_9AGAR|nr:hypothetical protein BDP27DRAFT_1406450 [Rhodocollybia butyracea]